MPISGNRLSAVAAPFFSDDFRFLSAMEIFSALSPAKVSDLPEESATATAPWLVGQVERIAALAAVPLTPAVIQRLRREQGASAAAVLVAIASVQSRAVMKFGPGVWMATEKSIAQATDRTVAAYKASLLGNKPVFDLCCGVGGDAMALAKRGPVVAVDLDPQVAAMATANLRLDGQRGDRGIRDPTANAVDGATVICGDATKVTIPPAAAIHVDPDRRPAAGNRVIRPSHYLPPIETVARWIAGEPLSGGRTAIVKLAPAAPLEQETGTAMTAALVAQHHRQWISLDGSVREQALLCGDAITAAGCEAGGRSAVRLWDDGRREVFAIDAADTAKLDQIDRDVTTLNAAASWIIDLDPAIRAAGLSAALAAARGWAALGGAAGFFGADTLPEARSFTQVYQTLWSGAADLKRLKRVVRDNGWWIESVKVRGAGQDPAAWTKSLRGDTRRDEQNVVVGFLGRWADGTAYAALARRVPTA